jgi:hypothetical protein
MAPAIQAEFFFFLAHLVVKLWSLCLPGRCSTTSQDLTLFPQTGLDCDPTYAFQVTSMTGAHHHTQLFVEMGANFLHWLVSNLDPPNLCLQFLSRWD